MFRSFDWSLSVSMRRSRNSNFRNSIYRNPGRFDRFSDRDFISESPCVPPCFQCDFVFLWKCQQNRKTCVPTCFQCDGFPLLISTGFQLVNIICSSHGQPTSFRQVLNRNGWSRMNLTENNLFCANISFVLQHYGRGGGYMKVDYVIQPANQRRNQTPIIQPIQYPGIVTPRASLYVNNRRA